MTVLESIFLGALQGVTEFIPVSSSGHLIVVRRLMNLGEIPLLYDVLLHISTLVVVIIVFRDRIRGIILSLGRWAVRKSAQSDSINLKLAKLVVLATSLTGVLGVGLSRLHLEQYPRLAAAMFFLTAMILIAGRFARVGAGYDRIGIRHAVVLGVVQGIAVLPGISRSGSTISIALLSGIDREHAGEFSFLISIPAVLGATVLTLFRDYHELSTTVSAGALTAGLLSSFVVGLVSLLMLIRIVKGGKLYLFSLYLIPLSIFTFIFI